MANAYVLRAGKKDSSGQVPTANLLVAAAIAAETDADAINAARNYPVNWYIGAGDYAWLTRDGETIWSLSLKEGP